MRNLQAAVLLLGLSVAIGWALAPAPEDDPRLVQSRRDSWQLPTLPRRADLLSAAALVSEAPMWGADKGVAAAPPAPVVDPRWRIAAVFGAGSQRGVLINFKDESRPPMRLKVGQALPSGHVIELVGDRELCIRINKKLYRLGVESRDP